MTDEDRGFLTLVGASAPDAEDGVARVEVEVDERHLNAAGTVHGGMLATLVDATMGAAVRSAADEEVPATSQLTLTYLRPARCGRLVVTAEVRKRGESLHGVRGGHRAGRQAAGTRVGHLRARRLSCSTPHTCRRSEAGGTGHGTVMSNDKAAEAREGLFDSVAGKAKEVAGAVSGRDDLVEEGQLQQAEARHRKEAVADEAVAEAKQQEAAQELRETNREAVEEKAVARARAEREEAAAERLRQDERQVAERDAARQEAVDSQAAEERAEALADSRLRDAEELATEASVTETQASAEQRRLQQEAAAAEQQAAQLRREAETDTETQTGTEKRG